MSFCNGEQYNLGVRYLLRQSLTWRPVKFPGLQGNWESISVEHLGVRSRDCYCHPASNLKFNVSNGFVNFCGHELNQSGKYDLGLFAHHPIKQEDKQRKMFPLVMEMLPVLVFIQFFPPRKNLIQSLWLPSILVSIYKPYVNDRLCLTLP